MITTLIIVLERLVSLYSILIIVYVLLSWLPTDRGILHDVDVVLGKICDPYLGIFKRIIPPIGGMIDVSPILALLVLQFAVQIVLTLLRTFVI